MMIVRQTRTLLMLTDRATGQRFYNLMVLPLDEQKAYLEMVMTQKYRYYYGFNKLIVNDSRELFADSLEVHSDDAGRTWWIKVRLSDSTPIKEARGEYAPR